MAIIQQSHRIGDPLSRFMLARQYDDEGKPELRLAPLRSIMLHVRLGDGVITRYAIPESWQQDAGIFERDKLLAEVCADPHRAVGEGWTIIDHQDAIA